MGKFSFVLVLALSALQTGAQVRQLPQAKGESPLTGNARIDLFRQSSDRAGTFVQDQGTGLPRKSPWLAAGMSLVVPGAGEFYAESYWKSALFLAVEVGAWVLAYQYDRKGDRQTDFFQNFANQHWSVVQYAQYTIDNLVDPSKRPYYEQNVFLPGTGGLPPWQRVNWDVLNAMEREIGGFYSHTLPPYGEQQYFELIGKYPQFNQGWDDANLTLPPDYFVIKANLTPRYLYYSEERGKANDYYRNATTFVTVALINHVVSAIDAAWSTSSYNRAVAEGTVHSVPGPYGMAYVPAIGVRYEF